MLLLYTMLRLIFFREEKTYTSSRNAYKVTMLCWSLRDDLIITSGSDYILRVWSADSGSELRQLGGHKDHAYVLVAHSLFDEYIFSAGHDGLLLVSFFRYTVSMIESFALDDSVVYRFKCWSCLHITLTSL